MKYFDLHCDTPYKLYTYGSDNLAVDFNFSGIFDKWKQCFAVWISDDIKNPFDYYKEVLSNFKRYLLTKPENLIPILTVENGSVIGNDITRLEILKNDGIRVLTLTWNGENLIAGGVNSDKGLTDFGKTVLDELNRLRIACDLSHLNRKSFFDVIQRADFPIATHSCCTYICDNKRNLCDTGLKLISEKNGIIGICFYPPFLGTDKQFEGVYRNICHMLDLGIENNISLGSDFDGADMASELCNIGQIPMLYEFLYSKNISICTLNKIFYENADNFFDNL